MLGTRYYNNYSISQCTQYGGGRHLGTKNMISLLVKNLFTTLHFRDIISNSFWNILASILFRGNIFVANIIIARFLGAENYGKYALLKSTIQVFELSIGIAFGLSMTKYISEYRHNKVPNTGRNIYGIVKSNLIASLILSIVLFVVLELSSNYIASHIMLNPSLLKLLEISLLYVLFNNVVQCYIGIFKGEEKFRDIFFISAILSALNLATVTILTYFYSLHGAVIALVAFSAIQLITYSAATWCRTDFIANILSVKSKLDFSIMSKFNIPAIISGLAAPPAMWYINLTMTHATNGYKELAYFNSAYQIFVIMVFLPVSISDSVFPMFNRYLYYPSKLRSFFMLNILILLAIAVLVGIIPFIFPAYVMSLFGSDFSNSAIALKYLLIAGVFSSILTFLGKFLATINQMWMNTFLNFFWAILVSCLASLFVNEGAVGIAKAFLISYVLLFILQFGFCAYYLRYK